MIGQTSAHARRAARPAYGPLPRTSAGRPFVFAHRGSSIAEPEHTRAAYLRAIEEGADGLECDVRLTRDGQLVCVHDRRLDRVSNGRGRVSTHTLAELSALDFGSWHPGPDDSEDDELVYDRDLSGRIRILTLDDLLAAVRDAGRPIRVLIETKHPTRYGPAVEQRLVATLRRYGLHEPRPDHPIQVSVMSFSALAVRRIGRLAPRLATVLLLDLLPAGLRRGWLPFRVPVGGPGIRLLRTWPTLVRRLHERGHQVYVWTVNEPHDLDLVIELGVEGIITDRPAYVCRRLDALGFPRA